MALTNKRITEIVSEVVGEDSIPIIEFLKNRKNISEFIIADKVKLDMHRDYFMSSEEAKSYGLIDQVEYKRK